MRSSDNGEGAVAVSNSLKFLLFADFHYKKGVYPMAVEHLDTIMKKAHENGVDYVIHCGDFCNDYVGSPEIVNAYINNEYGLPVYGVLGNHELEYFVGERFTPQYAENPMAFVTARINNVPDEVVWGTPSGKYEDGRIGYYYFDVKGIRMICTDTNFSYSKERDAWEHNITYHAPLGNVHGDALGPDQLGWLEEVLTDAAHKGIPCMVIGHAGLSNLWYHSFDWSAVQDIYQRANAIRKGTVLFSINGHYHTDHLQVLDNVLYMDVNTVLNGWWVNSHEPHYEDGHTFEFVEYDADGNAVDVYKKNYHDLSMGNQTWFFKDPLSCIVTVTGDGKITIEGMESGWVYDVVPTTDGRTGVKAGISSGKYKLER